MDSRVPSADELRSAWASVREEFKLRERHLSVAETAGMLIGELGGTYPALRFLWFGCVWPWVVDPDELANVSLGDVRKLIFRVWVSELGDQAPTREYLAQCWRGRPGDFNPTTSRDAWVLA